MDPTDRRDRIISALLALLISMGVILGILTSLVGCSGCSTTGPQIQRDYTVRHELWTALWMGHCSQRRVVWDTQDIEVLVGITRIPSRLPMQETPWKWCWTVYHIMQHVGCEPNPFRPIPERYMEQDRAFIRRLEPYLGPCTLPITWLGDPFEATS